MEDIKDALCKPEAVVDRWILRLGKAGDEAGKFSPWHLPPDTFEQDLESFLACLNLVKLHEAVKERMSLQKKGVREAKKLQREARKVMDKAAAKAKREAEKAQLKLDRAAEKERIKADAKRAREQAKNVGRIKSDNEVPRKTEDTLQTAVEATVEPVAVVQSVLPTEEPSTLYEDLPNAKVSKTPVLDTVRPTVTVGITEPGTDRVGADKGSPEGVVSPVEDYPEMTEQVRGILTTIYEDFPAERKPYVIPEEG